ncbi:hypothetical protein [Fundidesulfovibrio terrae]|uniref:hypothetical protein n=1 Tax=Fundidesulfovibrio terrae TaxID=2922866 RepID=UPI001FB003CF|nr:hypothetical protein [Fundidesulfovibrio terrae]
MFGALKDMAVSSAITSKLAPLVDSYCHSFKLTVNSSAKVMTVEALPRGEAAPVQVEIVGYRLFQEEGRAVLAFESLKVSREWLGALASTFLPDNRIKLPEDTPYDLLKQHI